MNTNKWIILAATALTLGACSNNRDIEDETLKPVELRFSSNLEVQTRAPYTLTQATQIENGEKVYAWVDEVGGSEYVHAWELTADGAGNFTGDTKNYPISGKSVDVYTVHGNFTGITAGTTTFPSSLLHSVEADQSTLASYAKSDLLCASGLGLVRRQEAHPLTFRHLLSKVEVYLVAGTGMSDAEVETATVTLLNTKPTTAVTLSKSATPIASISAAGGTATPITAHMQYETDQTVTIEGTPQPAHALAEAIVIPQWVNTTGASGGASVDFIQITVGSATYKAQINKEITAGNRFVFNVVINKSGISLSSTILPWGAGDTSTISAQ